MNKLLVFIISISSFLLWSEQLIAGDCASYRVKYQCPGTEKYPVHLSFDDGPADVTLLVLNALRKEKINATFFTIAGRIDCEPYKRQCNINGTDLQKKACQSHKLCLQRRHILQRIKNEGHTIGSHSYEHVRHSTVPPRLMETWIRRSKELLSPYLNTSPPLFRLPYGDGYFNQKEVPQIMQTVEKYGFKHIGWEMSAFDWKKADQHDDKILATAMHEICTKKRGVILFHDGDHSKEHGGRDFTANNIAKWLPVMRCVADFKPLNYFCKDIVTNRH